MPTLLAKCKSPIELGEGIHPCFSHAPLSSSPARYPDLVDSPTISIT